MKKSMEIIERHLAELKEDMVLQGKKEGTIIWKAPHNEERSALSAVLSEIRQEFNKSEEGIREEVSEAFAKASEEGTHICYARSHCVLPDTFSIYVRDADSPSGVHKVGGIPRSDLSRKILSENNIKICC